MNTKIVISATAIFLVSVLSASGCIVDSVPDETSIPQDTPLPQSPRESTPGPTGPEVPPEPKPSGPASYSLPTQAGQFVPQVQHESRKPSGTGEVIIEGGVGIFGFNAAEIETIRPDIFQPGHFSLFDILVHLDKRGDINLEYRFDEIMNTHIIDAIDDETDWWYSAYYSGGWPETNVFRMDMYPYKDGTTFRLSQRRADVLGRIYNSFREEVARLRMNQGKIIIPEVAITSTKFSEDLEFENVMVTPHNVRNDIFKPEVVTTLDILLSLLEQGELSQIKLTWYEQIGTADVVDSYWTEQINQAEAYNTCGFVYETGPLAFSSFRGSHIHIPSDVRVIVSPEYALWFWICL
jgi:hypothetical protein